MKYYRVSVFGLEDPEPGKVYEFLGLKLKYGDMLWVKTTKQVDANGHFELGLAVKELDGENLPQQDIEGNKIEFKEV